MHQPDEPPSSERATDADDTATRARPTDPSDPHTVPEADLVSSSGDGAVPGYEIRGEIARGGMGVVLGAWHLALGREVAIKTLLPDRPSDPNLFGRFVTEAHITARLQHPAVPPVFEIGQFADGRPYMVMKLIRGHDLAHLLRARPAPTHDLPKFVAAFEQICYAIGFAHSRGVIHRDLKPSNAMIGEFNEVQLMDWGLAKALAGGTGSAAPETEPEPIDKTEIGKPLGTPAYMAPEQARGEWSAVGPRADVFALGGILTDILTGRPPFVGTSAVHTLILAGTGDVAAAFARLNGCGADPELVALCKRCLSPNPADRPADGKAVGEAVAAYRTGVEARLRKAEAARAAEAAKAQEAHLRAAAETRAAQAAEARAAAEAEAKQAAEERAAAQAEAKQAAEERAEEANRRAHAERAKTAEQRKRQLVQMGLAAAVTLLLFCAGAFGWWYDRQSAERESERRSAQAKTEADQARREKAEAERKYTAQQARAGAEAALKLAADLRTQHKFREAGEAAVQAENLAKTSGADDLLAAARREKASTALARDLDAVRARKWAWVSDPGGNSGTFDTAAAPGAYAAAFAAHGLDVTAGDPTAVIQKISASPVRHDILRALDDWALTVEESNPGTAARVLDVARRASPVDDIANKLRDPAVRGNPARLNRLIEFADDVAVSVPATLFVAALFERRKGNPSVLLAVAQAKHPTDFDLTFALALWFHSRDPQRAIGHYRAARAIRTDHPAVLTNLGLLLGDANEPAAAVTVLKEATRLHPDDHIAHFNLGGAYIRQRNYREAEDSYRAAIQLSPNYAAAHSNLGVVLGRTGDGPGALASIREAVRLAPGDVTVRVNFGFALQKNGDLPGAIREYRRAIELDKEYAPGHFNLGAALGIQGDTDGRTACFREAARLDPKMYGDLLKKLPPDK